MDDVISKIKECADLRTMFRKFYPEHYRSSGNCVCPFHNDSENKPSLSFFDQDQKLKCFGACNRTWDAIDLYQHFHRCDTATAIKALAEEHGIAVSRNGNGNGNGNGPPPTGKGRPARERRQSKGGDSSRSPLKGKNNTGKDEKRTLPDMRKRWESLTANPLTEEARAYLAEKRALGTELIDELRGAYLLGCDPQWRQYYIDPNEPGKLKHEVKPAVAFPVTSYDRKALLGIQMVPFDGTDKRFAKGSETKEGFFVHGNGGDYCIVCEAVIDALSVYTVCKSTLYLDVISIYSASQCSKVKLITGTMTPILFFDHDFPGIKATVNVLLELKTRVSFVNWSKAPEDCKDANALLQGGHSEAILSMVRSARRPQDLADLHKIIGELLDELRVMARNHEEEQQLNHLTGEWQRLKATGEPLEDPPEVKRIKELNEQYAVLKMGSKCLIIDEAYDPNYERDVVQFTTFPDFKNFYLPETYWVQNGSGRSKLQDIGTIWYHSPLRRQYDGVIFLPGEDIPGFYNLYQGFTIQPKKGDWSLFQEHIFSVIANKDMETFSYILTWIAHLFQQPGGDRPGVALVLRGDQGTGKGFFVNQIGKIIGQHYVHITSPKHLTGHFNVHLKDALLVFCDEGVWGGDKAAEGTLKAMITEEFKPVEAKGKDVISVRNFVRLIVASNNEWVVPAGKKERRFCVLDVSPIHIQDRKYFAKLHEQMDNGGREAMLHDLLSLDISKVDFGNFPRTDALSEQQTRSLSTVHRFWLERLVVGTLLDEFDRWDAMSYMGEYWPMVTSKKLHDSYLFYGQKLGERFLESDSIFVRSLKRVCPQMESHRITTTDGRKCAYKFPPLGQCRKQFCASTGMNVQWPQWEDA